MKTLFNYFVSKEELEHFPLNAPWYFQWGLQGMRTLYSYHRLNKALKKDKDGNSASTLSALEHFKANKFSCIYGRRSNANIRNLIEESLKKGIATQDELRAIVQYRDILENDNGTVQLNIPKYRAIGAIAYICSSITYFFLFLLLFILTPANLSSNLPYFVLSLIICAMCLLPFYWSIIHPYRICHRIYPYSENLNWQLAINSNSSHLHMVK